MPERIIAIGDIHGYQLPLAVILGEIGPEASDRVIPLGDYCDRGPDTRGVIDLLLEYEKRCCLIPLLGNHDALMLRIVDGEEELLSSWLGFGGEATLASYGVGHPRDILEEHLAFFRRCRLYYETEEHLFVHAAYESEKPLETQAESTFLWEKIRSNPPGPHFSGKVAIVGHTAQRDGEILDLGYLKCIDTCCYGNGWLTAMEVQTGEVWQVDKAGMMRSR